MWARRIKKIQYCEISLAYLRRPIDLDIRSSLPGVVQDGYRMIYEPPFPKLSLPEFRTPEFKLR